MDYFNNIAIIIFRIFANFRRKMPVQPNGGMFFWKTPEDRNSINPWIGTLPLAESDENEASFKSANAEPVRLSQRNPRLFP